MRTLVMLLLVICSSASAQTFGGGGGAIPAFGTGGDSAIWPTVLPDVPFVSSAQVNVAVVGVCTVKLYDLEHGRLGDLHVILESPTGSRFNILHRPGFTGSGVGNLGTPQDTPHVFTGMNAMQVPISGNMPWGIYKQSFGAWTDPSILNTPTCAIAGPPGTWKLYIYDWGNGETGSISHWDFEFNCCNGPLLPVTYCTAKTSSSGCWPQISYQGSPSHSGNMGIIATGVEVIVPGSLLCSISGSYNAPFYGGYLCILPPVLRQDLQWTPGGGTTCMGMLVQPMNGFFMTIPPGTPVYAQYWFRDSYDVYGIGLTNALFMTCLP